MTELRGNEQKQLIEALELVDRARKIVDGYAPTAGAHLGSATIVIRALISSAPTGRGYRSGKLAGHED